VFTALHPARFVSRITNSSIGTDQSTDKVFDGGLWQAPHTVTLLCSRLLFHFSIKFRLRFALIEIITRLNDLSLAEEIVACSCDNERTKSFSGLIKVDVSKLTVRYHELTVCNKRLIIHQLYFKIRQKFSGISTAYMQERSVCG
jgi:hypothetical protein